MDNRSTPTTPEINNEEVRGPHKNILGKILLLSLTSFLAFFFLNVKDVFLFITSYAIAVGILAFFIKEKIYGALVIPVIASFSCFPHFLFLVPTLLFMVLLAFLCSSYLKDRPSQFAFFTMCALMYSFAAVGGCVLVAIQYFGSVEACLETVTQYVVSVAELMFNRIPERLTANVSAEDLSTIKEAYLAAAGQVVYLLPSVLMISSMYAALLTKRTLTKTLGGKKILSVLFSTPYYPPVALAIGYMILSFVGIFFVLGSDQGYYIYMNLVSVLSVIFACVGAVEYISVLRRPIHPRQRIVYIVMGLVIVGLLAQSALSVLAYYGAYRTVFSRVRVIKIVKK